MLYARYHGDQICGHDYQLGIRMRIVYLTHGSSKWQSSKCGKDNAVLSFAYPVHRSMGEANRLGVDAQVVSCHHYLVQWWIQRGFHGFHGTPLLKGCLRNYYAQTCYLHYTYTMLTLELHTHNSNNAHVSTQ